MRPFSQGSRIMRKSMARCSRRKTPLRGRRWIRSIGLVLAFLAEGSGGLAEQLPIRVYTTADGLARDQINSITLDSRGYLWICTTEGLSRFDGVHFTNYGIEDGLPHRSVTTLVETKSGEYWVATTDGLCRYDPSAARGVSGARARTAESGPVRFQVYRPSAGAKAQAFECLLEDRAGTIWGGTRDGLYRLTRPEQGVRLQPVDLQMPRDSWGNTYVLVLLEDDTGSLWVGTGNGLYHRRPGGQVRRYTTADGLPGRAIQALIEDPEGNLWVGTDLGLARLRQPFTTAGPLAVARVYTTRDGLAHNNITSLLRDSDGGLWAGTGQGLSVLNDDDEDRFRSFTRANGLKDENVTALAQDSSANLWVGTESGGLMRIARTGLSSFGIDDGLGHDRIAALFETLSGDLCAVSGFGNEFINVLRGRRFVAVESQLRNLKNRGWGWYQSILQDHTGEWWVPTGEGLYRFPKVDRIEKLAHVSPKAVYTVRSGLAGDEVFRLYEDSRGDVWISMITPAGLNALGVWERSTGTIRSLSDVPTQHLATAFREDQLGNMWIGYNTGRVARYRNGQFVAFGPDDGMPRGFVHAISIDRAGRLWIASGGGGAVRVEDVAAARPRFAALTTQDGLSSNDVRCIAEDKFGRLYFGTGRGVDRWARGQSRHYTTAEGLANSELTVAFRDRGGSLWFGTLHGLSRLVPSTDRSLPPSSTFITRLAVAGDPFPISDIGAPEVGGISVPARQVQLQVGFLSISPSLGSPMRYRYRLAGADLDWCAPTEDATVTYMRLAPGEYQFQVEALSEEEEYSQRPATVSFTVLPPVWRRWWFLMLSSAAVLMLAYALHRLRVSRLIAVEQARTHIATDLHDDIGSSLSRMAILSEVLRGRLGDGGGQSSEMLGAIAQTARELVGRMSDAVWAIDPARDDLDSLISRVREFAADMFESRAVHWRLDARPEAARLRLGPIRRRHLLLIFKEAINNIVRHADCRSASMQIVVQGRELVAVIQDDGRGFDTRDTEESAARGSSGGHGLPSMQRRAAEMGGRLQIESAPGKGTQLALTVPLR